jgi:hypothetical protein
MLTGNSPTMTSRGTIYLAWGAVAVGVILLLTRSRELIWTFWVSLWN